MTFFDIAIGLVAISVAAFTLMVTFNLSNKRQEAIESQHKDIVDEALTHINYIPEKSHNSEDPMSAEDLVVSSYAEKNERSGTLIKKFKAADSISISSSPSLSYSRGKIRNPKLLAKAVEQGRIVKGRNFEKLLKNNDIIINQHKKLAGTHAKVAASSASALDKDIKVVNISNYRRG